MQISHDCRISMRVIENQTKRVAEWRENYNGVGVLAISIRRRLRTVPIHEQQFDGGTDEFSRNAFKAP